MGNEFERIKARWKQLAKFNSVIQKDPDLEVGKRGRWQILRKIPSYNGAGVVLDKEDYCRRWGDA